MAVIRRLASRLAERMHAWWQRQVVATILLVVCAVIALAGIGFAVLSGYLALRVALAAWAAALIMAGALLILALITALVANAYGRRPLPPTRRTRPASAEEAPVELASRLGRDLGRSLNGRGVHSTDVLIAALVAGVALGASPALRERFGRDAEEEPPGRRRR